MTAATGIALLEDRPSAAEWVAEQRRIFRPGKRGPCGVCKRYRAITQAHHIIPLATQYERGYEKQSTRFMWLCPTHHTAIHALLASARLDSAEEIGRAAAAVINDLIGHSEELGALLELYRMAREIK